MEKSHTGHRTQGLPSMTPSRKQKTGGVVRTVRGRESEGEGSTAAEQGLAPQGCGVGMVQASWAVLLYPGNAATDRF